MNQSPNHLPQSEIDSHTASRYEHDATLLHSGEATMVGDQLHVSEAVQKYLNSQHEVAQRSGNLAVAGVESYEAETPQDFLVRARDFHKYQGTHRQWSKNTATRAWTALFERRGWYTHSRDVWQQTGLEVIEKPGAETDEERYALSGMSIVRAIKTAAFAELPEMGKLTREFIIAFVADQLEQMDPTNAA